MKRDKITILILSILMLTFIASLDVYVIYGLEAIDTMEAYILSLVNVLTFGLLYTCVLFLTKKQSVNKISYEEGIKYFKKYRDLNSHKY